MNNKIIKFWKTKINLIDWYKIPKIIFKKKKNNKFEWYPDGKLNIAYNCLIKKPINKIAIYYIDKNYKISSYTYEELSILVNKFAYIIKLNLLKNNGKNKDQNIIIHASASIESAISMLACAQLGIPHSVIFENLSNESIYLRMKLLKTSLIITRSDQKQFNKDIIPAVRNYDDKNLQIISFSDFNIKGSKIINIDIDYLNKFKYKIDKYNFVKSNHTLFTLFTSGSTGEPKGIVHSSGGYLLYSKYTCVEQFGIVEKSVVVTASDAGWINGHTYALYGPLSLGATTVLFEKSIILLNYKFLKKIIKELNITILYLPVTLIRMLKSIVPNISIKRESLKTLGSMGEPLAPSVGKWYAKFFNLENKAIINTYFQTETAGIISSPKYSENISQSPHGSVGKPINDILNVVLIKDKVTNKKEIKISNIWPGCMKNILNGKKQWNQYWDKLGRFNLFDLSEFDKKKCLNILGRIDDVINIRGHRIGSEEIESIILKNENVAEVSAIAISDVLEGNKILIFIVQKKKKSVKIEEINTLMLRYFGSFALPKKIYILPELPKTRSGKILRRLMKEIVEKPKENNYGDLSTLINPKSIIEIKKILIKLNNEN